MSLTVAQIRELTKKLKKPPEFIPAEIVMKMALRAEAFYTKHPSKAWTEAKRKAHGDI